MSDNDAQDKMYQAKMYKDPGVMVSKPNWGKEVSEEFELTLKAMLAASAPREEIYRGEAPYLAGKREAILEIMLWLKEH